MNFRNLVALATVALAVVFAVMTFGGNKTRAAGPICTVPGDYGTIQAAVNDVGCTTINVGPGSYVENLIIARALVLNGAQAGNSVGARTFGSGGESKITGQISVQAAGVTIDGFSLTNPGQTLGILIKTAGDSAVITNNIIDTIGNATMTTFGGAQAIYLENGPDNVQVVDNSITNIQSLVQSSKGILIGDSGSANASLNILVEGNSISNVKSGWRGAYGVQVNNGASTAAAATGFTTVTIQDNVIADLAGGINPEPANPNRGWAHAIGLEGDTPGVVVNGNSISNVIDANPIPGADAVAVFFESNPSFSTGQVNGNSFDNVAFGIVVHPLLSGAPVNGACNWWGSADGPGPVGPGSGAGVSPNVTYSPWQTSPGGACVGPDADGDGVTDSADNCPTTANPGQEDNDIDTMGDVCDPDDDNDGVPDATDNCDFTANPSQTDTDSDGLGNACDPDDDNDGVLDGSDQCPGTPPGTVVTAFGCPVAVNANNCKNGGWQSLFRANGTPFKNQGDCIQYVNTGK